MSEQQPINPSFPVSRVKKIVKIDKDITRLTSEALFLISGAAEVFLNFLAEKSSEVVAEKKRKTIKLDDFRVAVKRHQPTREFLLDSLPLPKPLVSDTTPSKPVARARGKEKVLPPNTRRIDSFFKKPVIVSERGEKNADEDVDDDEVIMDRVEDVNDVIVDRVEDGVIVDRFNEVDSVVSDRVEVVDCVVPDRVEVEDDIIADYIDEVVDVVSDQVEDVDDVIEDHVEDVEGVIPVDVA